MSFSGYSDSIQIHVCKETMKKIPGSSNISVNDLELIRKICTLPSSSSHMSALIKLKKKKFISKLRNPIVNKLLNWDQGGTFLSFCMMSYEAVHS